MNQQDIDQRLDKMIEQAENDLDIVFAKRLKVILDHLALIYRKYAENGELTRTEMYKYNRFQKEMAFISKEINEHYKQVYKDIESLMQESYIENYLMSAYLYQLTASEQQGQQVNMGYTIPSIKTVNQVILNPIKELTLPNILNNHRNEVIRKINIELAQGIQAGESYSTMAERLERVLGFSRNKARLVARTEAGRCQSISRLDSGEQASKHADLVKVWVATLDNEVRRSHRVLDDQEADEEGYFHYKGHKAKAPKLFGVPSLDLNCRCDFIHTVNGERPQLRRARNYEDAEFQLKVAERIDKYMEDGKTFKQAEKKALKEIKPPTIVIGWQSFGSWKDKLKTGDLNVAELLKRR